MNIIVPITIPMMSLVADDVLLIMVIIDRDKLTVNVYADIR